MIEARHGGIASEVPALMRFPERVPAYAPQEMHTLVGTSFCTMDYRVAPAKTSPLTGFAGIGLGTVDVYRHEGAGKRFGARGSAHIRQHWADDFVISMPLDARVMTRQNGHVATLEPGGFVFLSTARPFEAALSGRDPNDEFSLFLVRISGSLLRQRAPLLDKYCGVPLRIDTGACTIMRSLFELALSDGAALSHQQLHRFNDMLLDAIANVATEIAGPPARRMTAQERVREDAIFYIERHLSNPDLCDREIALHCKVSARYLQASFAAAGTTVVGFIRNARLTQCRADLLNPGLSDRTIFETALSWGFSDAPYFSRAYKAQFGLSPSADRNRNRQ
jgi:AraC-like DNA-binding protein